MGPGSNPMTAAVRNDVLATFAHAHGDVSTAHAGRQLQAQHGVYTSRTWRAFYTEWKAFDGDPPGYAARSPASEPWISSDLIHRLLSKEKALLDQAATKEEMWVAEQLAEKYGILTPRRWQAHVLARIEERNKAPTRLASPTQAQARGRAKPSLPHKATKYQFWEVVYEDDEPHNIFTQHEKEEIDVDATRAKRTRRVPAHIMENREAWAQIRAEMNHQQAASQPLTVPTKARSQPQSGSRRTCNAFGASYSLASSSSTDSSRTSTMDRSQNRFTESCRSATTHTGLASTSTSSTPLGDLSLTPEQMAMVFAYGTKTYIGEYGMEEVRYARSLARQWGGSESLWYSHYDLWYNHEEPFCDLPRGLKRGWGGRPATRTA